ncbi:unnamed protein product [Dracunculus medinensis]|uniref:MAM domain-containing protein n=1 Tax=Dracunculus medinensis TaxID=318479 RepID=A0A0N4U2W6_DRAME|nr:unnamed protein product [Dracunculus medinensis]
MLGQIMITNSSDLCCNTFDALFTKPCRWRNEWSICEIGGDQMDWIRAKNSWGDEKGYLIFGTEEKARDYFIIAGSHKKLHSEESAMLVSDPAQCQEGDGLLTFRYWTSPKVKIRACIRRPNQGRAYNWCSKDYIGGDPGPANITIPGSILHTFEIVIEARNFNFDAFGLQGGLCIVDEITYSAIAVHHCKLVPHIEPPIPMPKETCRTIVCSFDNGKCLDSLRGSGWKLAMGAVGNRHTGIRKSLKSNYAYARGPGTKTISFDEFDITREAQLEFCYYRYSFNYYLLLSIYLTRKSEKNRKKIFTSQPIDAYPHHWICEGIRIDAGIYAEIDFVAEKLKNENNFVGIDQIGLTDPKTGISMCKK